MDQNVIDWVQNPFWKENILAADAKRRVGEKWELGEYLHRLAYAKYHKGNFFSQLTQRLLRLN